MTRNVRSYCPTVGFSWVLERSNSNQLGVQYKASKGMQDTEHIAVPDVYCIVSGLVAQDPRVERYSTK